MMHFKILIIILVFVTNILFLNSKETINLSISSDDKINNFKVEIAKTYEERSKGLMFRDYISDNMGMLFIFPNEDLISMWMKNTLFSLDILFISKNKIIVDLKKNAKKLSNSLITSKIKAKYVLEINSGLIDKYKINIGDQLYFEEK
tara:strand:- start:150 stop:590 length:441 start_codon:yes stop_codon:yes gene_type:complete